jgi:DNA helicase-2/ATP-dependent DNA helicase PcrA
VRWIDNPKHHISGFRVLKLLPGVGPGTAMKILDYLQLHQFQFAALAHFKIPNSATSSWKLLLDLLICSQSQDGQWPSQMELAKLFYQPLLEENYEDFYVREGDVEQIISIAGQYPTRESFISELTLDPPISSGDLCDKAHKDDDFLILSTIHSAKGQEWNNVFILNVADGNFPNEYAADNPKAIEEERRLLNVAITRAKQNLHLIQPLKYWVPEQPKYGDKHVYGAKSRFLTKKVSQCLKTSFYPEQQRLVAEPTIRYQGLSNVQNKIRDMW